MGRVDASRGTAKIDEQVAAEHIGEPANLEEQALSLVGRDIFEKLVKEYTEKQWGRDCKDLPAFIIKRLPVRLVFDNNYFNDRYQGIPIGGYTKMVERMLEGTDVRLNCDYKELVAVEPDIADRVIYCGPSTSSTTTSSVRSSIAACASRASCSKGSRTGRATPWSTTRAMTSPSRASSSTSTSSS